MAEDENVTLLQKEGDKFEVEGSGGLAVYGSDDQPALQHRFGGQIVHTTPQPLVHMICWEENETCPVEVSGRVTVAGDKDAPVEVRMTHVFGGEMNETVQLKPFDHVMKVDTQLSEPIHHALQLRTPVQLRFCNPWNVASDYHVDVKLGRNTLLSIHLTGATVATPQPCDDDRPCPPAPSYPVTP